MFVMRTLVPLTQFQITGCLISTPNHSLVSFIAEQVVFSISLSLIVIRIK